MGKSIVSLICLLVFVLGVQLFTVNAQDDHLYVCRTPDTDVLQLEFHNIPLSWRVPTGDEPGMWYLGDSGYFDPTGDLATSDTLIVYALTDYMHGYVDEINFIRNGMAIIGLNDYTVEMVGTANTPFCGEGKWTATMSGSDFSVLPEQTTPEPTPTDEPIAVQPQQLQQVVSTGRSCVAMYTKSGIVLVGC